MLKFHIGSNFHASNHVTDDPESSYKPLPGWIAGVTQ